MAEWRITATAACCVKALYFSLWNNSLKFEILWFFESRHHRLIESIAKIAHFYILTLPGGVTLTKKSKKNHFFKGCGEKMTITPLIMKLAPWNYVHSIENKILLKIRPKRDTRLQKKSSRARFFLQPWSKFPPFFQFFWLKWVKSLTFNI